MQLPKKCQELIDQAEALNSIGKAAGFFSHLGIGGAKTKNFAKETKELRKQINEISSVITKFNTTFQPLGWIMSESTNIETAKQALNLVDEGKIGEAEILLAQDYEDKNLDSLIRRFTGIEALRKRELITKEAASLCNEKRYLAAIPLILIVTDGIGQDCFGKSTFSEGTDLTELSSIAGHQSALPSLTSEIAKRRQKFNNEEITFPYRNGIMHGRDVNYGNRLVASKSWAYLSCLADIIRARQDAPTVKAETKTTFRESLRQLQETKTYRKRTEEWVARPDITPNWALSSGTNDNFENDEPEKTLIEFLHAWKNKNYGIMGKLTVYFDDRPIKQRAGQIREHMSELELYDALIIKIKDEAPAVSEIDCLLTFSVNKKYIEEQFTFRMIYGDNHSSPLLRFRTGGSWKVIPFYQGLPPAILYK